MQTIAPFATLGPVVPVLHPIKETLVLTRPGYRTITENELSLLDDWCKENGSTLIPGYEGEYSDGIGVAIKLPYSFNPDARVNFIMRFFDFLDKKSLRRITSQMSQTVIKMEWFHIFPRLIVTI